jgi:hypothetical protein
MLIAALFRLAHNRGREQTLRKFDDALGYTTPALNEREPLESD